MTERKPKPRAKPIIRWGVTYPAPGEPDLGCMTFSTRAQAERHAREYPGNPRGSVRVVKLVICVEGRK